MGVLACDRNDCENIMCDTYLYQHYICHDCLEEFKAKHKNDDCETREEWMEKFIAFMQTPKIIEYAM